MTGKDRKNMRKKITFLLIATMILTSFSAVFAADTADIDATPISAGAAAPADVKDTNYEDAVSTLMGKGIISGYMDGTFRPGTTINRAEACVIVIKAMGPSENNLSDAPKSSFKDLTGYDWAAKYIDFAAAKGVITGYADGTFRPAGKVTYAEMASMLIRALGYKTDELTGVWPDNFISKAAAIGIFKGIDYSANTAAIRGSVALMTNIVADNIANGTKPEELTEPGKGETGESGKDPSKDQDKDQTDYLADFSGRAYGILLDTAKVLNAKGDTVDEYEFLIGNKTLYLKTNGKVATDTTAAIDAHLIAGEIYGLQMNSGVVTKFGTSDDGFLALNSPAGYSDFSIGAWADVKEVKNHVIETKAAYGGRNIFTALDNASVYIAKVESGVITGYKAGSISDINADMKVRLYAITGDNPGIVEIVLTQE